MKPRSEDARRFIEIYDMIRSDKTGPLSRRDLDWSFLAGRFDTLFELSRIDGQLAASTTTARLGCVFALNGDCRPVAEFLPFDLNAEVSTLFDEMTKHAGCGILAVFGTEDGARVKEYELVLLPAEADGVLTAIGVVARLTGPTVEGADFDAGRQRISSFRLREKSCFDLRQPLLPRLGGFLTQCVAGLEKFLPGGKAKA